VKKSNVILKENCHILSKDISRHHLHVNSLSLRGEISDEEL